MKENKNSFSDMAKNALSNFEAKPPEGMWDRIQSAMYRKRKRILIFRYSSIAASLLLILAFGVSYFHDTQLLPNRQPVVANKTEIKQLPHPVKGLKDNTSGKSHEIADKSVPNQSAKNTQTKAGISSNPDRSKTANSQYTSGKPTDIKHSNTSSFISSKRKEIRNINKLTVLYPTNDLAYVMHKRENFDFALLPPYEVDSIINPIDLVLTVPDQLNVSKAKDDKWDLAVNYALTSSTDFKQNGEAMNPGRSSYTHDEFSAYLANETSYFEEVKNTIHDAPLTLGITVDKRMLPRLSVETGLLYTKLGFRVKTDEFSSFYSEYRNLIHYLGIPAGIRYSFIERRRYDLYALQWFILEKGIAGRWYVNDYGNNTLLSTETNNHSIRGVQFSSLTGIGGQIRIANPLYLFGQGGVQLFFLNKTQPYNIRSSHVAWPTFQVGIRLGL